MTNRDQGRIAGVVVYIFQSGIDSSFVVISENDQSYIQQALNAGSNSSKWIGAICGAQDCIGFSHFFRKDGTLGSWTEQILRSFGFFSLVRMAAMQRTDTDSVQHQGCLPHQSSDRYKSCRSESGYH